MRCTSRSSRWLRVAPTSRRRSNAAVQRAMATEPDHRFPSAGAFAAALTVPLRAGTRGRMVSARAAVYAVGVVLAVGIVGGWALARSPFVERSPDTSPALALAPIDGDAEWRPAKEEDMSLTVVDRTGRPLRTIAANRPWTPRFSPDGRQVAYGAFGSGRSTSDVWVTDLDAGTTRRLTDDENDSNDPQWSSEGATVVYSVSAPDGKDLLMRPVGAGDPSILATRAGTQFASDWLRDGTALLVTEETAEKQARHPRATCGRVNAVGIRSDVGG